ncbi:uncharacterized protein C8A04DRAFT_11550, partial [Dichotomopilus funicola]
ECDRAFTRSDALAKHMRTVHETEALRPSDPVPKSMQAATGKSRNLKIIIKTPQSHSAGQDDGGDDGTGDDSSHSGNADIFTPLTAEQGFSTDETRMSLERLMRLCRLQVKWAEDEGEQLRTECKEWEALYKREWLEKEVLLEQVVESEQAWQTRRNAVLAGEADVVVSSSGNDNEVPAGATADTTAAATPADANDVDVKEPMEIEA